MAGPFGIRTDVVSLREYYAHRVAFGHRQKLFGEGDVEFSRFPAVERCAAHESTSVGYHVPHTLGGLHVTFARAGSSSLRGAYGWWFGNCRTARRD